jgi:hypothetical protein
LLRRGRVERWTDRQRTDPGNELGGVEPSAGCKLHGEFGYVVHRAISHGRLDDALMRRELVMMAD